MSNDPTLPSEQEELDALEAEAQRHPHKGDLEMEVFDGVRGLDGSPVTPTRLTATDSFNFRCHKGVSCWNRCCHGADITLTPLCVLRLSGHLKLRPAEFLLKHTVPAVWAKADLPVAKLKMGGADGRGACPFMTAEGCSVYAARPATCRYYPLGLVSIKHQDSDLKEDFHFLVKEAHCQGHAEAHSQTVGAYRDSQGVAEYDEVNRGWIDILMKMASWSPIGGPWGKEVDQAKKRMFFMVATDVDAFRRFVFETKFLATYEIAPEAVAALKTDDRILLRLGFDWLKTVFFNEPTLAMKEQVLQDAIAKSREEFGAA